MVVSPNNYKLYFFHVSFLKEVSETWLDRKEIGAAAKLFMSLLSNFCQGEVKELMTCHRTMQELSKSKYTLTHVPAYIDAVKEKFLPNNDGLEHDEYSLKIASFMRIGTLPSCFIVSDSEKEKITTLAKAKGYTIDILSPSDF